jgi:hypothetical protein
VRTATDVADVVVAADGGDTANDGVDSAGDAGDAAGDAVALDALPEAAEAGPPGPLLGVMSFGGAGIDSALGAVFDASGNAYVVGHAGPPSAKVGTTTLTIPSNGAALVLKLDPQGNVLWARAPTISAGQQGDARGIAINSRGNVVIGANFAGTITWGNLSFTSAGGLDAALFELDPAGNVVGGQRYGGANDEQVEAVAALPGGGVAAAGRFSCSTGANPCTTSLGGGTFTGQGNTDALLLVVDGNYGHVFSTSWGGPLYDEVNSMVADAAGHIYLTGAISGTPTVGGQTLPIAGGMDVLYATFTSSGTLVFAKTFGSTANDKGQGIALLPGGDVVLAGALGGPADFGGGSIGSPSAIEGFAARVSSGSAAYVWANAYGTASTYAEVLGYTVGVGSGGTIALPLVFSGTVDFGLGLVPSAGGKDALVLNVDAQGNPLWNWRIGGPSDDQGNATAVDSHGNVLFMGQFAGTATIGTTSLGSNGGLDGFVVRVGP